MIKPKYQYFLLPFIFIIIGFISIFNFIQAKNLKHAIIVFIEIIVIILFIDMILLAIINSNFKIDLHNQLSIPGLLYAFIRDIIIGGLFIWDQKKNIDFNKLTKEELLTRVIKYNSEGGNYL